jgi:hypothetical protein
MYLQPLQANQRNWQRAAVVIFRLTKNRKGYSKLTLKQVLTRRRVQFRERMQIWETRRWLCVC